MLRLRLQTVLVAFTSIAVPCMAQQNNSCVAKSTLPNPAAICNYYETGIRQNGIVGGSIALIRDGRVVLRDDYGLQGKSPDIAVDDDTTFHWASCTKSLTGIAIMQLRDRGLLRLDDPLIKYIPELAVVHDGYGSIGQVTIRHMMSHSGGFRNGTWPWRDDGKDWQPFEPTQWSQIVAMLPYTEVGFAPGSKFSYSNLGVVFLGEIIERLSGDPYQVYMEKNVLRPLGMSRSYFDRSPYFLLKHRSHSWDLKAGKLVEDPFDFDTGVTRSNGGLNAPVSDMLKYLEFLIGDTSGDPVKVALDGEILKRSSLEEMWKPVLAVVPDEDFESRAGAKDEVAGSFFVHTDGKLTLVGHAGWQNGFRSHFYIDPKTSSGYIVAYNTDAQDEAGAGSKTQNTRSFDFELRDYLIDHFFAK
jgi:CubicO group peptidase (beta-lactamase class C family)